MNQPVIAITSGEPAGIGPDIVAQLDPAAHDARLLIYGDRDLLRQRAASISAKMNYVDYPHAVPGRAIELVHEPLITAAKPGHLDSANAPYVLRLLARAGRACLDGECNAMVTAPVNKNIINRGGIPFSGHTEYLAELCAAPRPVMLLLADQLRVALATTHLPLREVADAIEQPLIDEIICIMDRDLRNRFGISQPHIKVCGLNPHAGENGYLGSEEIDTIIPAIQSLQARGIRLSGPYPADTLFTEALLADADAVLAMYHDQGLPVLKYVGFHNAVNTTLGLPIVRTSVDHGTAIDLAGTDSARADSLRAAIDCAILQVHYIKANANGA